MDINQYSTLFGCVITAVAKIVATTAVAAVFFELNMLPDNLANKTTLVDGMIRIAWAADGHNTLIDPAWLRSHCYSESERKERRHKPALWDVSINEYLPEVDYQLATEDQTELLKLHDAVRRSGICDTPLTATSIYFNSAG